MGFIKKLRGRLSKKLMLLQTPASDNFSYNQKLWDHYVKYVDPELNEFEDTAVKTQADKKNYQNFKGDEWGTKSAVQEIIQEYIIPFTDGQSVVGEIGLGHGRVAINVAPKIREFYGFDISKNFLAVAQKKLSGFPNVHCILLHQNGFPVEFISFFDFIYAFDVFVHLDLHGMRDWFQSVQRALKPGGKFFVHTTNLATEAGWKKFLGQKKFTVESHYLVTADTVNILAQRFGFTLVKESTEDKNNFYKSRDYLAIFEKNIR